MKNYKLGNYLYKARIEKGLTQEKLGELLGINGKSVSKWERGITMPNYHLLKKLCIILNISSDDVLKFVK